MNPHPLTPVAALELDLAIDRLPCGILQLRRKGDGRALVRRQALVTPEQPDKPATLLNLCNTSRHIYVTQ
jgi:hypothetical protein